MSWGEKSPWLFLCLLYWLSCLVGLVCSYRYGKAIVSRTREEIGSSNIINDIKDHWY